MLFLVLFSVYIFHHMYTLFLHVHLPLYSYTFTRSSDFLDLHIQICGYVLMIRYLERITGILRNLEFSLFDYRYSCLTFISVDSLFSTYITFSCYFILLFICYHVWSLICYCSDIDLS